MEETIFKLTKVEGKNQVLVDVRGNHDDLVNLMASTLIGNEDVRNIVMDAVIYYYSDIIGDIDETLGELAQNN